jgi:hypothetical protein
VIKKEDQDAAQEVRVGQDDPEHVRSEGQQVPEVARHGQRPSTAQQSGQYLPSFLSTFKLESKF